MNVKQRVLIWTATAMVVLVTGVAAWRSMPDFPRLHLREPVLTLPDPNIVLNPRQGGRPLLLVVIENTPQARPQAGLADACLVYALPTEALITRFMAAFCQRAPKVIGPVRSVRRHMLDIASDVGGILVHAGQSEEARQVIAGNGLPVINQFTRPGPFWRDPARQMPHNLYTGFDRLLVELEQRPIRTPERKLPYSFSYDGSAEVTASSAPAAVVSLNYGALYDVRYVYDASKRRYLREQAGRPHLDADGRQIAAASVLVAFIRWRDVLVNGSPSSQIDLVGGGRLAIVTAGHVLEGRWTRSIGGPLEMTDGGGRSLVLPPGPVWIELFPVDRPFEVHADATR
ncbi:MAG: DUF3048 domain-containing protein [Armatimonadota bacterium]|nr:DUF3048 domain-containing protein [Armatimonadota bacterium]